jgi:platelet-activating factor acetylhydrolase
MESAFTKTLIMLAASVLKRLLWLLRCPSFAPVSGTYRVGAIQTRFPNSIACQIHYPADTTVASSQSTKAPYFRPKAVDGVAMYSRTPAYVLQFLAYQRHPCLVNAEPLQKEKGFPIVLFSHGLGGSMEMYTQLCHQIASHGYLVVAMEHEDGSGAFAETPMGEPIPYKSPDDTPYSRQKVWDFRRPFLQQRVQETTAVLDILLNQDTSLESSLVSTQVQKILQTGDASRGVAFVGHSFGATTMILAAQKDMADPKGQKRIPNSLSLLDPWCFALEDDAVKQGIPASIPTLSILSEAWLTNPETKQVDQLLQQCQTVSSWYIPCSAHASFSDAVSWLPRFLGSKLYLCHKNERKHKTIPTAAMACVKHFQSALHVTNDHPYRPPLALSELLLEEYKGR